jgi:NACHT domain
MRPLRVWLLLVCVLLVLFIPIVGITYVLGGGPAEGLAGRADVWAALLATLVFMASVVAFAWQRRRRNEIPASTRAQVDAAADLLATRTRVSWSQEVVRRGIQAPVPVEVTWRRAEDFATASDAQTASAPLPNDPTPLPGRAGRLSKRKMLNAGLVTRLHDKVYARLQHGRLVVIGGPGAGKTSAMILLLMEALSYRERLSRGKRVRVPVPVWLTMGTWDPGKTAFRSLVTTTISRDHPYLLAKKFGADAVPQLFEQGRIALFLDGLDEMPETLRAQALLRLAEEAPGLRVVISSRPEELRHTLDTGVQLPYTPVVELRPVIPPDAAKYLLEGRSGTNGEAWQNVANHLLAHPDGVLARTLNTPLTLSLARSAYRDRDPGRLLDFERADERALRDHLLDQVLFTAYPEPSKRDLATFWLGWLAYMMNTRRADPIRDLRWWDIPNWLPRVISRRGGALLVGAAVSLVVAVVGGLVALVMVGLLVAVVSPSADAPVGGPVAAVKVAFVVTLVSAMLIGVVTGSQLAGRGGFPRSVVFRRPTLQELLHGLGRGFRHAFRSALVVILCLGGLVIALLPILVVALVVGLATGLAVGLVSWLTGSLLSLLNDVWSMPMADSTEVTPNSMHSKDAQTQLVSGLVHGIGRALTLWLTLGVVIALLLATPFIGLASRAVFWLTGGLWVGFPAAAAVLVICALVSWLGVTLIIGVISGLVGGLGRGSAPLLLFSEIGLRLQGEWVRFMPLLEGAMERQVMRQAGAVYQFRHADLQDRLADQYIDRLSEPRHRKYVTYVDDPY